jgi:hypothetical protein
MTASATRSTSRAVAQVARYDLRFFRSHPRFTAAMAVFLLIPAL